MLRWMTLCMETGSELANLVEGPLDVPLTVVPAHSAALYQVASDLTQEEGIPVAARLDDRGKLPREPVVREHHIQIVRRLLSIEPPQGQLYEQAAFDQFVTNRHEGMCRQRHLRLPVCTREKNARQVGPAQKIRQDLDSGCVRPVEIVDRDDKGEHGRDMGDEAGKFALHPLRRRCPGPFRTRMRTRDPQWTTAERSARTRLAP